MAIDLIPFGSTTSDNVNGTGSLSVLLTWLPLEPRPIPVGDYDAVATALERLYYLWSRSGTWRQLADYVGGIWAAPVEQQAQLAERRLLANACGATLDEIGYGVGLPRQGLGCEDYRSAIRVRGAALASNGLIADVLAIIAGLFGDAAAAGSYSPWYPAGFALFVPALTADQVALLASLLWNESAQIGAIPAGVGLTLVVTDETATGWSYSDPATDTTWAGPRWDYSGGSDISATGPWGYAVTV